MPAARRGPWPRGRSWAPSVPSAPSAAQPSVCRRRSASRARWASPWASPSPSAGSSSACPWAGSSSACPWEASSPSAASASSAWPCPSGASSAYAASGSSSSAGPGWTSAEPCPWGSRRRSEACHPKEVCRRTEACHRARAGHRQESRHPAWFRRQARHRCPERRFRPGTRPEIRRLPVPRHPLATCRRRSERRSRGALLPWAHRRAAPPGESPAARLRHRRTRRRREEWLLPCRRSSPCFPLRSRRLGRRRSRLGERRPGGRRGSGGIGGAERLDALVADADGHARCGDDRGDLDRRAAEEGSPRDGATDGDRAARRAAACCGSAGSDARTGRHAGLADRRDGGGRRDGRVAEERQPDRQRQQRQALERLPLLRRCPGEPRAGRALGDVLVESLALLARQPAVALARERELRALAGDEILELLRERAARAEQQRLERRGRETQQLGDLLVRASLQLAHHERLALARRDPLQRAHQLVELDVVVAGLVVRDVLDELDHGRTCRRLPPALAHDVVRDGKKPVRRLPGLLAALERA